jgi:FKBP12-rapamycin complex-associated protein
MMGNQLNMNQNLYVRNNQD